MSDQRPQTNKPSQAEGEDPERDDGQDQPTIPGKPSQAEGEDDGRQEE